MRSSLLGALALSATLASCAQGTPPAPSTDATSAPAAEANSSLAAQATGTPAIKLPPRGKVAWDWQIGASSDAAVTVPPGVTLIDLDGFTISANKVAALKRQGVYTVCYLDVGSYEPGRPDSGRYPNSLKLQQDPDWPAEYFLDIRDVFRPNSVLAGILIDRMKMCKSKGFDALEPDNLQNDENVSGGRITAQQQLDFNGWVADRAHELGLAVLQKNGPDKILRKDRTGKMMVEKFDGILNEQCQEYDECASLAEYRRAALNCSLMSTHGINAIRKDFGLVGGTMRGYLRQSCP